MVDPDLALLEAAGRGDRHAFELLVKRFQRPLLNFIARYLGDRSTAEDLTQEAFLRIYRAAPRFEAKTKVSTWVFRIAYHLVLTELDRRRRCRNLSEALCRAEEAGFRESLPGASGSAGLSELEEEVMAALAGLPDNQRAALLLRIHEDLSYVEIGEVLGVGVQSVESLLFRARKSLRQSLGRTGKRAVKR